MHMHRLSQLVRRLIPGAGRSLVRGVMLSPFLLSLSSGLFPGSEARLMESEYKFKKYFSPEALGFEIEDFAEILRTGKVENDKGILVILDPQLYNERFLQEVQLLVMAAKELTPRLKVCFLSTDSLSEEQRTQLQAWLGGKSVPQESLFLLRREGQLDFDILSFEQYFQNQGYLQGYFEKLNLLTAENTEAARKFLEERLQPDQLILLGVLDPADEQTRIDQITRLRTLKLENPSLNSEFINIIGVDTDPSWVPEARPGDLVLVQSPHYSRLPDSPSLFRVIPGGLSLKGEAFMKTLAEEYYQSNIFAHPSILEASTVQYLVKVRVDLNQHSQRSLRTLHDRFKAIRRCLQNTPFEQKVLFLLEKVNSADDQPELLVQDIKRADYRMMYSHIIKDKATRDRMLKQHPFLKDDTLTYMYKLDPRCGPQEFMQALEQIETMQLPMHYQSEDPADWKVSHKLVASTFHDAVIATPTDQAVYFYSACCTACKQFGKHFEAFAVDTLMRDMDIPLGFNRINKKLNHLGPSEKSFHSTPVFALYKRQCKGSPPLVYKQSYFTPELLRDFYLSSQAWTPLYSTASGLFTVPLTPSMILHSLQHNA